MKRIVIEGSVRDKLLAAAGAEVDVSKLAVFETSILNTGAIRKNHPVYKGAKHTLNYLNELAAEINRESRPLLIMHDSDQLPVGRLFSAQVLSNTMGSEVRALMWIDLEHADLVNKVENGTINQVSVSAVAKQILCSECGHDFVGPEASLDGFFSGTCPNGHTMGVDGAHATMDKLENFYELSLVGRGGIAGTGIMSRTERRLAADGTDVSPLTLNASPTDMESSEMKLEDVLAQLTTSTVAAANATAEKTLAEAQVVALKASVETMTAEMTALKAQIATLSEAKPDPSLAALRKTAQDLLTKTGDVTTKLADTATAAELQASIDASLLAMKVGQVPSTLVSLKDEPAKYASAFQRRS